MKRCLIAWMAWGLLGSLAQGTPGQSVTIDERLLGENAEFFAVIRTEHDNLGSYYKSRTKVFLDERSKVAGRNAKEVLLADSTSTVDPDHQDATTPPKVTVEVAKKDERVLLGELLVRYPLMADGPGKAQDLEGFRVEGGRGVLYGDRLVLVDGKTVAADVFGGRMADVPAKVVAARDSGRAIYLKLAKEDEDLGDGESHWVCVPPALTTQVRAHRTREQIYFSAGSFPGKEAALAKAAEWRKVARAKKVSGFNPEIWSVEDGTDQAKYLVVLKGSLDLIQREKFAGIGEALGVQLVPVSSEKFREWTAVGEE